MRKLVIMNVTNRGNMLDHCPMNEWPVFQNINPRVVSIKLGDDMFHLRTLQGYSNRGGVNNKMMGRWINQRYGDTHGLKLLFEVTFNEQTQELCYNLLGKLLVL